MSRTLEVHVTQEDIDKGKPADACNCAIALAVARQEKAECVTVDSHVVEVTPTDGYMIEYRQTLRGKRFIKQFDKDKTKVKPTTFRFPRR